MTSTPVLSEAREKEVAVECDAQGWSLRMTNPGEFPSLPDEVKALAKALRLMIGIWREKRNQLRALGSEYPNAENYRWTDADICALQRSAYAITPAAAPSMANKVLNEMMRVLSEFVDASTSSDREVIANVTGKIEECIRFADTVVDQETSSNEERYWRYFSERKSYLGMASYYE